MESPLGAVPLDDDRVRFRVCAPAAERVAVRVGVEELELEPAGDGIHEGVLAVSPGVDYRYVLDGGGAWPDPCSRWQPDGVSGPSRVLDTGSFAWSAEPPDLELERLVVYELHVGTFSAEGTFDGAIKHLPALRDLGVTAIELMPVATFPGDRGWGYDGLYTSAPHEAYGGPHGLTRLVEAAHAAGLGVLLDVVYNHVGPGNEALTAFGPYFSDRHDTVWGQALDYTQRGVREWAIQNAALWARDYRVDGLRLDAVATIADDESPRHVLTELRERVPELLLIDEMEIGNLRPLEEWGHDAQWNDAFHHAAHVLLTGEHDGYYEGYGKVADLARELERSRPQLVVCAQNHDQVGNRAIGDRLTPEQDRVALSAVLFSRSTPLLFQGEEYGETRPFQFFTDHTDPAIAEATREGRRKEFATFESFSGEELPDPQAESTFRASKLAHGEPLPWVRELLALRPTLADTLETEVDEDARTLVGRRGEATLRLDFANTTVELDA
ncbi:MAG: alpha-amylase family glycosyl hydrolase [Gaiellaceae bacterium]